VAYSVAAPSLVPALVPHAGLAAANGRLELVRSAAFAAGPALAGALVAWSGASPAFMLAAVLSALAASLLWNIEEPTRAPAPRRPVLHDLREGAGFAWSHPLLRPILLTAVAWNLSWFVLQAAYVPYAVERLGLTAATVGITLAAYGAGMVVGAALASRIARVVPFGALVAIGPVVSVAAAGAMLLSLWAPGVVLPMLSFFLFGTGPIIWTDDGNLRRASARGGHRRVRGADLGPALLRRPGLCRLPRAGPHRSRLAGAAAGAVAGCGCGLT